MILNKISNSTLVKIKFKKIIILQSNLEILSKKLRKIVIINLILNYKTKNKLNLKLQIIFFLKNNRNPENNQKFLKLMLFKNKNKNKKLKKKLYFRNLYLNYHLKLKIGYFFMKCVNKPIYYSKYFK